MGVEIGGRERHRRRVATRQVAEADDRQLRGREDRLEVVRLGAASGEERGEVVVVLDEMGEPCRAEVLPGHPELECTPAPGALEAQLVEVELVVVAGDVVVAVAAAAGCLAAAVVLGRPAAERLRQVRPLADEQSADVVRLKEPFVRIDGDRIGPIQIADPGTIAGRESDRAAVRRVHVEPQILGRRDIGELADRVHGPGVRGAGHGRDREGLEAGGAVAGDGQRDWRALQAEPVVGRDDHECLGREAEQIERAPDREVALVRGVDADVLEHRAARRPPGPQESPEVDVPGQGHAHEVGHDAARCQQPE